MSLAVCRICLEKNEKCINIFDEEGYQTDVKAIVEQHFWFQIGENDGGSKQICVICWQKIESFHGFYTHISTIHKSLDQNTSFETQLVKLESDVDSGSPEVKTENNEVSDVSVKPDLIECLVENSTDSSSNEDDDDAPDFGSNDSETESNEEEEIVRRPKRKQTLKKKKVEEEDSDFELNDEEEKNKPKPKRVRKCRTTTTKVTKKKTEKAEEDSKAKTLRKEQQQTENQLIRQYFAMECELCSEKLEDFACVRGHYRQAHKQRGYLTCCSKKMWKRFQVLQHIQLHIDPESFKCEICNKTFVNKYGVEHHMMYGHSKEAPSFKCDLCPKTYYTHNRLETHKIRHGEKSFICKDCGKGFYTNSMLNSHMRNEHEETNLHICDICAKSFKAKINFETHMKYVHAETPQPKIQCQLCGNWLKHEAGLRKHMRRHKDQEKSPVSCSICSKAFPHRDSLGNHMRLVHTLARAFACDICNKAFKRAYTLREHMTTHTGEVLYNCQFCPKTFNSSANMHAHRKKMHPVEWAEEKHKKMFS